MPRPLLSAAVGSLLVLVSIAECGIALAQTPRPTTARDAAAPSAQWEYLVVSFGKTVFNSPLDSGAKQAGKSKVRAFSEAGVLIAHEASDVQEKLDTLGRFGWEMVSVVGSVGGDQQFIFKRKFDPARSQKEAALIKEEGTRLRGAADALAAERASGPAASLVDLDEVDHAANRETERSGVEKRIRDFIASAKYHVNDLSVPVIPLDRPFRLVATVQLDGTALLLKDGKNYRTSEAMSLAGAFVHDVAQALDMKLETDDSHHICFRMDVTVNIKVGNSLCPVAWDTGKFLCRR